MSTCIKTGAVLLIPAYGGVVIGDLHLTGGTVVMNATVDPRKNDYERFMHYPGADGLFIRPATHEVSERGIRDAYLHKDKGIIAFPVRELLAYSEGDKRLVRDAMPEGEVA